MTSSFKRGAFIGFGFAILLIAGQPFYPLRGLIPELVKFFTTVPLWIAVMIFHTASDPLLQGLIIMIYFAAVGAVISAAFGQKRVWGWLFVIMLTIHHYVIDERVSLKMGEIVQAVFNHFH